MNINGMLINGINVKSVEHYGNLHIRIFQQKDLLENFLMVIIERESK